MILFWYGEETFTLEQKLRRYRDEFKKRHDEHNLTLLDGEEVAARSILAEAEAMPFLGEKRMIIVRNFLEHAHADEQTIIADHLASIPDTTVLILTERTVPDRRMKLFKALEKKATVEVFEKISPTMLPRWIKERAAIQDDAAAYLATIAGDTLWHTASALEKLSLFAGKRPITIADIDALIQANLMTSIFRFTDALGERNGKKAINAFKTLVKSGEDLMRVFYMIVRHVRLLIQAHEAPETLRQPPFVLQTLKQQAKNFTMDDLRRIYAKLLAIDVGVKTGTIRLLQSDNREFLLAIERWIVTLCRPQTAT